MLSFKAFLAVSFLFSCAVGKSGDNCSPVTKFFNQNVDHFGPSNQLFPQQYQILDTYFKPGGPILFYQGGETVDMICLEDLILPTWAKDLGALAVTMEHRFFGESKPNNLVNLTQRYETLILDNVMEDSVNFIIWIKDTINGTRDSPVIATGGSYAGYLSTMLRQNHPKTFHGAIGWSAPLRGLGYEESNSHKYDWYRAVSNIYQDHSADAAQKIKLAIASFAENITVINTASSMEALAADYNLCSTPQKSSDLSTFLHTVEESFSQNTQLSWGADAPLLPGRKGFALQRLINRTLEASSHQEVVNASLSLLFEGSPCADWTGTIGTYVNNEQVWYQYILCTYVPLAVAGISNGTIFPEEEASIDSLIETCRQIYGILPGNAEYLERNYHYSPCELKTATRLFITYGGIDPVMSYGAVDLLSLVADTPENAAVAILSQAGHAEDMSVPYPGAKESVRDMQNQELEIIKSWIENLD